MRKILISAFILLLLAVVAGVIYIWYSDQHPNKETVTQPKPIQELQPAKPIAPDPKSPVGVAAISVDSPVAVGQNSSISISTKADSKCTIVVTYADKSVSKDSGLAPKTADAYGQATWTWTVGKGTAVGKGSITVNCAYAKKSGMVIADLQVTK